MTEPMVYFYVACAVISGVLLALISILCLKYHNYGGFNLSSSYSTNPTIPPSNVCPIPPRLFLESTVNEPYLLDSKTALLKEDTPTADSELCLTPDLSTSSSQISQSLSDSDMITWQTQFFLKPSLSFTCQDMSRQPNEPIWIETGHPRKVSTSVSHTKLPEIDGVSQVESQN